MSTKVSANTITSKLKETGMDTNQKTVGENDMVTILWGMPMSADRALNHNRRDIIIKAHTTKHCTLIDIIISSNRKVSTK